MNHIQSNYAESPMKFRGVQKMFRAANVSALLVTDRKKYEMGM